MKLCASSQFPFVRLGYCGEVVTGSTPPKANSDFWGGEIPFVTPAQLGFQPPITTADEYVTREGADRGRLLPEGAVLVCCIGSLGKTGTAGVPLISNQQINAIIFDPIHVDARYGYHAARSLTPLLKHVAPSTTVAIVKKSTFAEFQIPRPPLPEQRRIAEILDKADALRAKRRAALAQLDTLTQSIFLDMFGDPATNPKGWLVVTIADICEVKGGKRLPKGEEYSSTPTPHRYIRVVDLKAGRVDEAKLVFLRPEIQAQIARYVVNFGDIIISIAGSIGLVAPVPATLDGVNLTENAAKLVPRRGGEFDAVFLAAYLQTPHAQSQMRSHVGQVTIGKLALFRIEKIKVPLPELALQREFILRISALRDHDTVLRRAQLELDALFASLQQRAFRGEL